ncbi:aspartate/glutamate racemase family protein [Nocardioides sp. YIM 152315]|uniref:aspartate/glutamate racemase family protein n=1 Tax=Nocardioides sp. YIM 152315 TaxID=3031760 RepID=UPI0023DA4FFB|nr:aspartate/glutamate racemase family protein [Nocardioides sp. YIM 152315]MDF1605774.1 aspartate/glutamate racemase family protein [Nocardioides sp. YIM 152315]
MTAAGLLHTVPALADTFQGRLTGLEPGLVLTHVADPSLLARAIDVGVDEVVRDRVRTHVRHLVGGGAEAVLVTCSSIGEAAEAVGADVGVPVVRVDEAMAEEAVRTAAAAGGRVAVLATLWSTLGPTERLLQRMAARHEAVTVTAEVVAGAAVARGAGDLARHDALVADAVRSAVGGADVVVLAQASMAAALGDAAALDVPVLESVSTGARRFVEVVRHGLGTSSAESVDRH